MSHRIRRRPTLRVTVAAVVGANVLVFGALAVAGVPLLPREASAQAAAASPPAPAPLASTVDVPARAVVAAVLAGPIPGAKVAGPVWASSGTPFDATCSPRGALAPVVSASRPFTSGGRTVAVQVAAYGAGQGAAAVDQMVRRLDACNGTRTYGTTVRPTSTGAPVSPAGSTATATSSPTSGPTPTATPTAGSTAGAEPAATPAPPSTAFVAWSQTPSSNATTLVWQRSDVVASVTVRGSLSYGLAPIAASVDSALTAALDGKCAAADETVADAGRSPWTGQPFTGYLNPRPVVLAYPTPTASPTPVLPSGVPLAVVPEPSLVAPSLTPLPTETPLPDVGTSPPVPPTSTLGPAVPVSVAPSPPVAPSSPPATRTVQEQVADPIGPGCGWAFTMQGAPVFDAAGASARYAADTASAQQGLLQDDANWQLLLAQYSVDYAAYVAELQAFVKYADDQNAYVGQVAEAVYQRDLAAYETALAAQAQFQTDRATALSDYVAAKDACAAAGQPTPTDTPTAEPTPGVTATPTPGAAECPPIEPPILSQLAPTVPPSPTPPG